MKTLLSIAAFAVLVSFSSLAQEKTLRVNARQKVQRGRVAEGRQSGELTKGEAALLNKQQRHIRRTERRTKADGIVTPAERQNLDRKQDRASRTIRRAKHNSLHN